MFLPLWWRRWFCLWWIWRGVFFPPLFFLVFLLFFGLLTMVLFLLLFFPLVTGAGWWICWPRRFMFLMSVLSFALPSVVWIVWCCTWWCRCRWRCRWRTVFPLLFTFLLLLSRPTGKQSNWLKCEAEHGCGDVTKGRRLDQPTLTFDNTLIPYNYVPIMKTICVNIIISIDKMPKNIFTYCRLWDLLGDRSSLFNFLIFVRSLEHVDLITSKHQTVQNTETLQNCYHMYWHNSTRPRSNP